MKKVFIDCGANNGRVTDIFFEEIESAKEYDIVSIEGNPKFEELFKDKKYSSNFMNKVCWVHDEGVLFKIDESDVSYGSSAILTKRTGRFSNNGEFFESIDIAKFINENYTENDFIVIKIDIEGGEYYVLPHIVDTGAIDKIDVILLDVHRNSKLGMDESLFLEKNKILQKIISDYTNKIFVEPDFWEGKFFSKNSEIFK